MKDFIKDEITLNKPNAEKLEKSTDELWTKKDKHFCPNDDNLLNLIAEIVVENIVRKLRNGCNRIHQDQ